MINVAFSQEIKKMASDYLILTFQSSSTLSLAALSIFQLLFLKQFFLLIYANSFSHFIIVIVCLFSPLLFRSLTDHSVFFSQSQPVLNSVQFNPVLVCTLPYIFLRDIHTYLFKGHLCTCESYSYIQSPFWMMLLCGILLLSYFHFSLVFQQHAKLNKFIMIYWFLLSSNLFLLLWCSCHMYLFLSLVWLS